MSFLRKLFWTKATATAESKRAKSEILYEAPKVESQVQYPPVDGGLPLATVQELLDGQADLISRIRTHAAIPAPIFEERYLVPIKNLAAYIQNLPATQDREFGGPGGLFRAALDLAFLSFQAADGRIFTGMLGVEDRHKLETRWRYICFGAGLLWPIGKTIESVRVQAKGVTWPARKQSLDSWSQEGQVNHVFLAWPRVDIEPGPSVNGSALAVNILGDKAIEWLELGSPQMMTALIEVAAGIRKENNSIAYDVLSSMWKKALTLEQARMPSNYGRVKFGQHLAPHIVDTLRSLLNDGKWSINKPPLHVDATGVYMQWPAAAQDIIEKLASKGMGQAPESPEGLLTMMADESLIKIDQLGGAFHDVTDSDGVVTSALKLLKPNIAIPDYDPKEYSKTTPIAVSGALNDGKFKSEVKAEVSPVREALEVSATGKAVAADEAKDEDQNEILTPPPPSADPLAATIGVVATDEGAKKENTDPVVNKVPPDEQNQGTKENIPDESKKINVTTPQLTYKEILPHGVIKSINDGLISGQLVKLIEKLKTEKFKDRLIFSEKYVAVPWDSFDGITLSPPNFLSKLGDAGYLHADPKARGRKMHELPVAPNSTVKDKYFLLARILTDKLNLTEK